MMNRLFQKPRSLLNPKVMIGSLCLLGVWFASPGPVAWAEVEARMNGDSLVSLTLPWAASSWPFSQVVEVQRNSVDPTVIGRVVFDRHGFDENPLLRAPFASPYPGRLIFVSTWGSQDNGCYMELLLQLAVAGSTVQDSQILVPTEAMLNVGGQVVTLQAQGDRARFSNAQAFQYSEYDSSTASNVNRTGVWYTGRHLFRISASDAAILSNAPDQNVPIRVVLDNRLPVTYEIGSGTVRRWREVFRHNPSCSGSGGAAPSRSLSNTNAPAAQPSAPTGYLLQQQGRLVQGGPTLGDGSLFQLVPFEGRAGQTVRITLQSNEFDTYLILADSEGNTLASNDDIAPGNTNSEVRFTLPYTGRYNIVVNAYDRNGSGQYWLTVE